MSHANHSHRQKANYSFLLLLQVILINLLVMNREQKMSRTRTSQTRDFAIGLPARKCRKCLHIFCHVSLLDARSTGIL
ncbi:hypothetical protein SPHINGOR109_10005 [Sphingorhabdus sp. 109]|nr:hypothetical protein SPHINGOR109_10005 [Sphingorhabdus sp. 109]